MKKYRNRPQTEEQDKASVTAPNGIKMYELPTIEFKGTIIKIGNKLRRKSHKQNENFNKEKI